MIEASKKQNLFSAFLVWHFNTATKELLRAWKNFLAFGIHYFPVKELFKTLFSHWRRSADSYGKGLDVSRWVKAFLGNTISRVLGAFIRTVIIIVGIVFEVFIFFAGLLFLLIWVCLPVLIVIGFFAGIGLLFGL